MKKWFLVVGLVILLISGISPTLAQSNVEYFFVACENQAVMNLSGEMGAGYDVYYQVFSASSGTGNALTALRQVSVNGTYAFSERVPYNSGATVAFAAIASAKIIIAREGNPSSTIYETTVDDLQDGCADPLNALGTSLDSGSETANQVDTGPGIQSPFGGIINPNINATPEPLVVIGARQIAQPGRSQTPGMIFAQCNAFPRANPGVLYDNDNVVVFWSWFAKTRAQVEDHIAHAQYSVTLNTAPFTNVVASPIELRNGDYWVFFSAQVGHLSPGKYGVEYKLTWDTAISDGYADYGPETDNLSENGDCTFFITPNPDNIRITDYNGSYSLPTGE
ncbi:MAG: hypothetical protein H6671_00745 [Anaerolineaceae bacterium]|nr:hypothetical protein [Anaerolineaceae bacterium]